MMAIYTKAPNSLIQSLLQSGADPHHIDSVGITVLHDAARERNIWAIKWLIAENVDLEAQTPVGPSYVPKAVFHHLLDNCYRNIKLRKMMLQDLVENLRVMQVLASDFCQFARKGEDTGATDWRPLLFHIRTKRTCKWPIQSVCYHGTNFTRNPWNSECIDWYDV